MLIQIEDRYFRLMLPTAAERKKTDQESQRSADEQKLYDGAEAHRFLQKKSMTRVPKWWIPRA
jgi:hypothetical protein